MSRNSFEKEEIKLVFGCALYNLNKRLEYSRVASVGVFRPEILRLMS